MMQERPFILLGSHALQTVSDRLRGAIAAWASEWCRHTYDFAVTAAPAHPPVGVPELQHFSDGTGNLWIAASQAQALAPYVLDESWISSWRVSADWSRNVVAKALASLSQAVASSMLLGDVESSASFCTPPASLFAMGSGAVLLECKALGLRIWTCRHVLRHVPPRTEIRPRDALRPLSSCLQGHKVPVTVLAGMVTLSAEHLLDLAPGDVLRIGTLSGAKAQLRLSTGRRLAEGTLGQRSGKRALCILERSTTH